MLYQLSHFRSNFRAHRTDGAESQNPTGDTAIVSRVLYQLSYLGPVDRRPFGSDGATEDSTRGPPRVPGGVARSPQSRPARAASSAACSGGSPVSLRNRLMRSTIGGWVEKIELERSSNFLIGFV
jgi:hypothetical protein